jgi:site-specific recombinase XerD
MLSIYRRHRSKCKFIADRVSKKCRCPLWATGTLVGKPFRRALKTRSWERATQLLREIEDGAQSPGAPEVVSIAGAVDKFLADCAARNLNANTLAKYKRLVKRLGEYCGREGIQDLARLSPDALREFRSSWQLSPRTASKDIERLRALFKFCVENEWLAKNPARAIKAPEMKPSPTLPFTEAEVRKILAQTDPRTSVFLRVLLHSGLRIIDAAQLRPEKIIDGKVFLYTQKTGTVVRCPLPPDVLRALAELPLVGGFFFAVESANPVSIAEYYRQKLVRAAKKAGVVNAHPHRFRDTFAVRLLERGVPLETVSVLLAHTDLKTTQRSYAPWVKSLQENLERAVAETWEKPALVRVK